MWTKIFYEFLFSFVVLYFVIHFQLFSIDITIKRTCHSLNYDKSIKINVYVRVSLFIKPLNPPEKSVY